MITSKDRAEFRSKANELETTVIVGKNGVSETVIQDVELQLNARGLLKCKVLETALLSAREACDEICSQTGAEGIQCVGNKFVIYRKPKDDSGRAVAKPKVVNPVKAGARRRKLAAHAERERRNEFFRQKAIDASIEKARLLKARKDDE